MSAALTATPTPTVSLFDIPIAAVSMDAALDLIDRAIADRRSLQIGVVNAAKIVNMGATPACVMLSSRATSSSPTASRSCGPPGCSARRCRSASPAST